MSIACPDCGGAAGSPATGCRHPTFHQMTRTYEDVWPSHTIGDDERTNLQERGEVVLHHQVEFGQLIAALDDLGIELRAIRLDEVPVMNGSETGIRVKVAR